MYSVSGVLLRSNGCVVQAQAELTRLATQRKGRQHNLGKPESLLTLPLPGRLPDPYMPFAMEDLLLSAHKQLMSMNNNAASEIVHRMHAAGLHMRIGRCGRVLWDRNDNSFSGRGRGNQPFVERRGHEGGGNNESVNGTTSLEEQSVNLQHSLQVLIHKL
jgi:hypothetical protein